MFLKLGDIRGESTHPSYMGWIRLDDLRHHDGHRVEVEIMTSHEATRALTNARAEGKTFPIANVVIGNVVRTFYSFESVKLSRVKVDRSYTDHDLLTVGFVYKKGKVWDDEYPAVELGGVRGYRASNSRRTSPLGSLGRRRFM